jgi:5,10-methylenetetrahydrofolate reductase
LTKLRIGAEHYIVQLFYDIQVFKDLAYRLMNIDMMLSTVMCSANRNS